MLTKQNKQDIFDSGLRAIFAQGGRSVEGGLSGACVYVGMGGRKCFAGHFISDDKYSNTLEGQIVTYASRENFGWEHLDRDDIEFMRLCQDAHDVYPGLHRFIAQMRKVAGMFDLNCDALNIDTATQPWSAA